MKKRLTACILLLALMLSITPMTRTTLAQEDPGEYSIETPGPQAENLTRHCTLS